MKYQFSAFILLGCLLFAQAAVEKSAQLKALRRSQSYFNEPANVAKFRSKDAADDVALDGTNEKLTMTAGAAVAGSQSNTGGTSSVGNTGNKDASSGRLFLKKFLLFKNMFGSSQQPVIPIIITGAGTGTNSPTTTLTTSPATGTGTVSPTTSPTTPPPPPTTTRRQVVARDYYDGNSDDLDQAEEDAAGGHDGTAELIDEQALQAALANGAQEYEVVSDDVQESNISGSSESKASQSSRINLRRKGSRRGQVLSVRIPPRYRRYFKKGQKVMLNAKNGSRPGKRRIIRRRVHKNRRRKNNKNKKGKRPRISG